MPADAAQKNRKIRQEALREQLSAQGHVQHVVEIANKLSDKDIESSDIQRLKLKADIHLALIKKYLPDLKAIEHSTDPDRPLQGKWTIEFINATPESKSET